MPKIKTKVNHKAVNSFLPYDGPALVTGSYNAILKNPAIRTSQAGNIYLNMVFEVAEPKSSEKAKFNGAAIWGRIMFMSEHENAQAVYRTFLEAVGAPSNDPEMAHQSDEDLETQKGSKLLSIGGKKIEGRKVRITVGPDNSSDQANAMQVNLVSPLKDDEDEKSGPAAEDEDTEDLEVADDEESEDDTEDEDIQAEMEARTKELKKTSLAELKEAATEAGIDIKGLKKADLVEAIVEWEFSDEEAAEDEDEDEEAEEEEPDVEVEDDEEEAEEEEDDEDEEAELREELSGLNRVDLKKRLKGIDEEFKVFKSTTDDALRDAIVEAELNKPPF